MKARTAISAVATAALASAAVVATAPTAAAADGSCHPRSGVASICVDRTTGYGPVVFVFDRAGRTVLARGLNATCGRLLGSAWGRTDYPEGNRYEFGRSVGNSYRFVVGGNRIGCSNEATFGAAVVTQETMDLLRWYGNANNVQVMRVVA